MTNFVMWDTLFWNLNKILNFSVNPIWISLFKLDWRKTIFENNYGRRQKIREHNYLLIISKKSNNLNIFFANFLNSIFTFKFQLQILLDLCLNALYVKIKIWKKIILNVVLLHKNFRIFHHYVNTETLTLKNIKTQRWHINKHKLNT